MFNLCIWFGTSAICVKDSFYFLWEYVFRDIIVLEQVIFNAACCKQPCEQIDEKCSKRFFLFINRVGELPHEPDAPNARAVNEMNKNLNKYILRRCNLRYDTDVILC